MLIRSTATMTERWPRFPTSPSSRPPRPSRLQAYALIAAASFAAYALGKTLPDGGPSSTALAMAGAGSCGWSWLLARALFDPARRDVIWPRFVVATVWLTGAASIALGPGDPVGAVAANAYVLTGSAALLITFVEPLRGFRGSPRGAERGFRIAFLAVYAPLVILSILLVGDGQGHVGGLQVDAVRSACAVVSLAAAAGAVWFRLRHPLAEGASPRPRAPTAEDARLAERIVHALRDDELYASPTLKVADLAARLGEPQHRVTRSIAVASGFANFNRLINHHRIERAKCLLGDPTHRDRSVLVIAYDCGFASLGPFNRAFRSETGMTPRAWRGRAAASA